MAPLRGVLLLCAVVGAAVCSDMDTMDFEADGETTMAPVRRMGPLSLPDDGDDYDGDVDEAPLKRMGGLSGSRGFGGRGDVAASPGDPDATGNDDGSGLDDSPPDTAKDQAQVVAEFRRERARRREERHLARERAARIRRREWEASRRAEGLGFLPFTQEEASDNVRLAEFNNMMTAFMSVAKNQMNDLGMTKSADASDDDNEADSGPRATLVRSARVAAIEVFRRMLRGARMAEIDGLESPDIEWFDDPATGAHGIRPGDILIMNFDGPSILTWQHAAIVLSVEKKKLRYPDEHKLTRIYMLGCAMRGGDYPDCKPTYTFRNLGAVDKSAKKGKLGVLRFNGPAEVGRMVADLGVAWAAINDDEYDGDGDDDEYDGDGEDDESGSQSRGLSFATPWEAVKRGVSAYVGRCRLRKPRELEAIKDKYVQPAYNYIMSGTRDLPKVSLVCSTFASMVWVAALGALDVMINNIAKEARLTLPYPSALLFEAGGFNPEKCTPEDLMTPPRNLGSHIHVKGKRPRSLFWSGTVFSSVRQTEYYASEDRLKPNGSSGREDWTSDLLVRALEKAETAGHTDDAEEAGPTGHYSKADAILGRNV